MLPIVNTATVATTTFDPDHGNDSDQATITVARAVSPAPGGPGGGAPPSRPRRPVAVVARPEPAPRRPRRHDLVGPSGGDATLEAAPSLAAVPSDTPSAKADVGTTVPLVKGVASVTLTCGTGASCKGTVQLVIGGKKAGTKGFSLEAGAKKTLKIRLSSSAKKALKRAKGKGKVVVTVGGAKPVTRNVKLVGV